MTAGSACGVPAAGADRAARAACVADGVRRALDARAVAIACVDGSPELTLEARVGPWSPELEAVLRCARSVRGAAALAPRGARGPAPEPTATNVATRFVTVPLETAGDTVAVLAVDLGERGRRRDAAVAVVQALAQPLALLIRAAVRPADTRPGGRAEAPGADRRLAVVAHELRRPLAPIASGVAMLRRYGTDVDVRSIAGMMERQVHDLARLVQDLLDGEPADAFDFSVRPQRVDLVLAVRDALQWVLPLVGARRHRVVSAIEAIALPVSADPLRLRQIIVNLLENAAKCTPVGGRVDVEVRRDGGHALLQVRDSGVGIPPERLPRIFDDACRTQAGRNGGGGLGIGLPLVRRLVVCHGGTVTAESDGPGRGSRFTVRLPLTAGGPAAGAAGVALEAAR